LPGSASSPKARGVVSLAGSYARFGQQKPLVCAQDMTIRDGNGQYRAAADRLGWTHVAAIPSDLDGVEISAYALAVNKTPESSEWNYERLATQLRAIKEANAPIDNLGWEPFELEPLLAVNWEPDSFKAEHPTPEPAQTQEPDPNVPVSTVRMAQLFLDTTTYPEFASMVETLMEEYATDNATDTVMECLRRATSVSEADPD
jgi:hypothetical protein